jgi:23S rRNA (guanosine2251-2'-O)-methyltransferase
MNQENTTTHYLYGMHPVMEALMAGRKIEKILFKQGLEGDRFRQLLEMAQAQEIPVQFVPGERIDRYGKGRAQGVVAFLAQIDFVELETLVENALAQSPNPLFVLLDGVSDVRNFGAIARTAECAGVSGLILPAKGGAAINADAVKTSAGALLRIPTSRVSNLKTALYYLKESGFQIVGATEKTDDLMYAVDFCQPTALVMGSEGKGISAPVLSMCDAQARIPMAGEIGSLNVSVATSVILYEAVRQRNKQ